MPKRDSSVRICGDYKVSINNVVESEIYPLPIAEDLFATLANGKIFSKIDLSNAYLQLELSDDSKKIPTVNTHKPIPTTSIWGFGSSGFISMCNGYIT